MKIVIAGPISTESIATFLQGDVAALPDGYPGAPLLGTLIGGLLARGHTVVGVTTDNTLRPGTTQPVVARGERFVMYYVPQRRRSFGLEKGRWGRATDLWRRERSVMVALMRAEQPDVVHAHWLYEFAWAGLDSGLPCLITGHDSPRRIMRYMPNVYRLVRYFMAKRTFARARYLSAVSPYLAVELQDQGSVVATVVPNPLLESVFALGAGHLRMQPGQGGGEKLAMVLNGWGKLKNPQTGLNAFALIRQAYPQAEMHLFGADYGLGETAQQWCDAHIGSERIIFHGRQPHLQLLEKLAQCALLIHPSLEEAGSMALVEAMALGIPIIGGRASGAVPWILNEGEAGVLVDITDPSAIAQQVIALIDDQEMYSRYSNSALTRARSVFSTESVTSAYISLYEQAISSALTGGHR